MEVSFAKPGAAESVAVTEQPTPGVPATIPNSGSLFTGDRLPTISEIVLPRINLVASVGGLKDSFDPGAYVFDQRVVLYTPPQVNVRTSTIERAGTAPVAITYLDFRPLRWAENVKGGARGLICNTEAQVVACGGTTNYSEFKLKERDGMKRFDPMLDCLVAIERPEICENDSTVFVFPVGDKQYALALYSMKASAYNVLKKTVLTARSLGCLRDGYATHSWSLTSRLEPTPDKTSTFWKPVLIPARRSTPEFLEWAGQVLAAPQRDAEVAE